MPPVLVTLRPNAASGGIVSRGLRVRRGLRCAHTLSLRGSQILLTERRAFATRLFLRKVFSSVIIAVHQAKLGFVLVSCFLCVVSARRNGADGCSWSIHPVLCAKRPPLLSDKDIMLLLPDTLINSLISMSVTIFLFDDPLLPLQIISAA